MSYRDFLDSKDTDGIMQLMQRRKESRDETNPRLWESIVSERDWVNLPPRGGLLGYQLSDTEEAYVRHNIIAPHGFMNSHQVEDFSGLPVKSGQTLHFVTLEKVIQFNYLGWHIHRIVRVEPQQFVDLKYVVHVAPVNQLPQRII